MSIQSYEEFVPRSATVQVGKEVLHVEELVAVKRDALIRIIMDEIDIVRLFGPFIHGLRSVFGAIEDDGEDDGENEENEFDKHDFENVFESVEKSMMNILGKNLTRVSCVVLDTEKNRRIVGVENVDCVPDNDGILFYEQMHIWVKENLTLRQEQELIKSLITTNDFVGLVKNYITLVSGAARVIGQSEEK